MEQRQSPQQPVDFIMEAEKRMAGIPSWQLTDYVGQCRWLVPLSIDSNITDMDLVVDAYPSFPTLKFTLLVVYHVCVARVDYGSIERHNNHNIDERGLPEGVPLGWLRGPHSHSWRDNRTLCAANALPMKLGWARMLPANVQGFENTFRWFCGENNILCGANEVPELPQRDTLL